MYLVSDVDNQAMLRNIVCRGLLVKKVVLYKLNSDLN